jgi:hypothetical protein
MLLDKFELWWTSFHVDRFSSSVVIDNEKGTCGEPVVSLTRHNV